MCVCVYIYMVRAVAAGEAHADVCWRKLTYADVCARTDGGMRAMAAGEAHAGACWRMLTYADIC